MTALLAACGGLQPPVGAPGATRYDGNSLPYHKTFHYTGKAQSFVVPAGVTSITIVAHGAAGAGVGQYGNLSGLGSRVFAVMPVTPRERLHIFVGGAGKDYGPRGYGGFNGGGNSFCCSGMAGGGASDIRESGAHLRDRILVAGGGGGQGGLDNGGAGGDGGGLTGAAGSDGTDRGYGNGSGASGGSQDAGGYGGQGGEAYGYGTGHGKRGKSGRLGRGGNGGSGGYGQSSDGQGGAGGGGGGGGSSYVDPRATRAKMWRGWRKATGDGVVVFSWQ